MAIDTAGRWGVLYQDARHRLTFPSEHVVRWLCSLPEWGGNAIDIGCGSGRHMRLLEDHGFNVSGVDAAAAAVSGMWGDMRNLRFPHNTFDVALAFGVFYYGTMGDADQAVAEMYRVLKPGGHGFVSYRTNRDWHNDHIDSHGVFHLEGHPEDGMLIDTVNEDELIALFAEFRDMRWELTEWTTDDRDRLNSDWLVSVVK